MWSRIDVQDWYGWVGGSVKYDVSITGYFNLAFQFGSSYCDTWCGACDYYRYEITLLLYIVGAGLSTGVNEHGTAGMFRLQGIYGTVLWNVGAY